jgi:hypothetical protein
MSRLLAQDPGVMNQPEHHGPGTIDDGMGDQQSVGVIVSGLRNVHTYINTTAKPIASLWHVSHLWQVNKGERRDFV